MPNARPIVLALISTALLSFPTISRAGPAAPSGLYGDFLKARFAAAQADSAVAANEYLHALEQAPGQVELQRQAFLSSALSGRPEAAGLAWLLPADREARLYLATSAARSGDWEDVAAHARALPHDELSEVLRPILLAWSEQARGRSDKALSILRPERDGPLRAINALHAGLIADLAGREVEATNQFEKAEAAFEAPSLRFAEVVASFDARHGKPDEARRVLTRAARGAPALELALPTMLAQAAHPAVSDAADGLAEAYLAAAASFRLSDQGETSLLLLRLALELRPGFATARLLAADVLETHRRFEEAIRLLNGIPKEDALSPLARLHLALVMQDQGNLDGALAELDALSRDWPDSTLPLEQKAGLLQAKGRAADAAAALDQAIARLPAHPQAGAWSLFYARAAARDGDGDCAACEADLLRALELSPEQPAVLNYLGYSWAERGVHLAEAQRMIEKAVRIDPNNGAIVDSLGWVMLRQGDQRNAVRLLERATELKPDDPTINGHLGDAYAAVGRQLEAQYQWRRALLLNPEAADAARLRSKLDDTSHPSGAAEETAPLPAVTGGTSQSAESKASE